MHLKMKRIFMGNLPKEVTEHDIEKRFCAYGKIHSTEIKRRPDGSVFAYINLEADEKHIDECIENVPKRKWHGQHVKVEIAKESFLDRLSRERQQQYLIKQTAVLSTENIKKEIKQSDHSLLTNNFIDELQISPKINNITKFLTLDTVSDESNVKNNKNVSMFESTENCLVNCESNTEPAQQQKIFLNAAQTEIGKDEDVEHDLFHLKGDTSKCYPMKVNGHSEEHCIKKTHDNHISLLGEDNKNIPLIRNFVSEEKQLESTGRKRKSFNVNITYNKRLPMFVGTKKCFADYNSKIETTQQKKIISDCVRTEIKKDKDLEHDMSHLKQNPNKSHERQFNSFSQEHSYQKVHDDNSSVLVKNKKNMSVIRSLTSEEKRLKSIEEKRKSFKNQKQTVKRALAVVDAAVNKKIIFNDSKSSHMYENEEPNYFEDGEKKKITNRPVLFNDESSEDETNDFKIKAQFEGRKGQKLLELQSRYANDKRFTLDERFYESENELAENPDKILEGEDEKKRQLNILQDVLGDGVRMSFDKRDKSSTNRGMLRFDPLKADHKIFEVVKQAPVEGTENESKAINTQTHHKKQEDEDHKIEEIGIPKVEVSKEKFYKVTDRLRETLKNKSENDTQFSLLEMFGSVEDDKGNPSDNDKYENSILKQKKQIGWPRNPFKYDSSDSEDEPSAEPELKTEAKIPQSFSQNGKAKCGETFFFKENDARLKEGIEFLTTAKKIEEEEFAKRRRELRQIMKSKIKNNQRKKRPWKKKLGGQKKRFARKKQ